MTKVSTHATLRNGQKMPLLGLGTWRSAPGEVGEAVRQAIKAGYRHIDGASIYMNEREVGQAINQCISEGIVKREDLFITSKLWNTHHGCVREACEKTLKDLGVGYLDLYLVHWPVAFPAPADKSIELTGDNYCPFDAKTGQVLFDRSVSLQQMWQQMEQLVDADLVKNIGVSNYTISVLLDLLTYCRIKPAVNQFECHPYFVRPSLRQLCQQEGIVITAYSPLGSGKVGPLQDQLVAETLAKKYKKSAAQILIRWSLQVGNVVIPKSSSPKRIQENFNVFDFELSAEDVKSISTLDRGFRCCRTAEFWRGFDFTEA